jgi:peptidoglycan hydrolase CwlO-like protein
LREKVSSTLEEFEEYKEESERLLKAINILEKEIRRTSRYVKILSKVKLP